jgi:ATP-dependent DNA helicase RecG
MVPPLRPLIEVHKYGNKMLVSAEIPEVSFKDKPCYYQGSGIMSGSFIRVSDGDRQLTQYEVQGFLDGRGQPRYDLEPVPESSIEDLDKELVNLLVSTVKTRLPKTVKWDTKSILRTYNALTTEKDKEVLTLSGLLCLGMYPQRYFPGLSVHVLAYPMINEGYTGPLGERLLDNVKIEGPISRIMPDIMHAIKRNLQKKIIVRGLFREDVLEYPEIFLREAIVNALVHRDYSPFARGTSVQIKIFPDRLEVSNPGGLFGPVTADRMGEQGLQASRNSFLIKLLEDLPVPGDKMHLCENRGTGIPTMIAALINAGMEPPQFIDSRTQFRVVCSNNALFDKDTLAWLGNYATIDLSERQRFGLAYIRHKQRITNPDYCRLTHTDSRIASRELAELVELQLLVQHGIGRWTYYSLSETSDRAAGKISLPEKQYKREDRSDAIYTFIKEHQPVSRSDMAKGLTMNSGTVAYWLRKLIKKGRIGYTTASTKDPAVQYVTKK